MPADELSVFAQPFAPQDVGSVPWPFSSFKGGGVNPL